MKQVFFHKLMKVLSLGLFLFLLSVPAMSPLQAGPVAPRAVEEEETERGAVDAILKSIKGTADKSKVYDTGGTGDTLGSTISRITQAFIGFLGVIATLLIIYAGYLWMTAGGDESNIEKAKSIIKQVIVGFIVLSLAYGIIAYVFYAITIAGSGKA